MSPFALALALALAAAPAGTAARRSGRQSAEPRRPPARVASAGLGASDVGAFPPEQQARWPLVVQKCGRCHSMDVSLNQGYTPAEWRASMRRMVRLPGAGISPAQAAEILEFLRFYSTEAVRR